MKGIKLNNAYEPPSLRMREQQVWRRNNANEAKFITFDKREK